tara:strand:- start:2148 stop:2714 length:567 start_codon:yes stop_codon:yes gene_type:complete
MIDTRMHMRISTFPFRDVARGEVYCVIIKESKLMKKFVLMTLAAVVCLSSWNVRQADAHCQVPCGIYDDHNRIHQINEDIMTIRKATRLIAKLHKKAKKTPTDTNQLVRWINTKEAHAEKIIRVVSDYFLTQKIKAPKGKDKSKYYAKLAAHHAVMKAAMKTKQTVSLANVNALQKAVDAIAKYWPKK